MRKNKFFRALIGCGLSLSILFASTSSAYAVTVAQDTSTYFVQATGEQNVFAAQVDPNVNYELSGISLDNIPYYMNDTLGFSELSSDKKPLSVSHIGADDLFTLSTINTDGTNTVYMFNQPIKYVDSTDNSIKYIDNSIVEKPLSENMFSSGNISIGSSGLLPTVISPGYKNAANCFTVDMPSTINQGVSLTYDDRTIILAPAVVSMAEAELKTVRFRGVTEQVVEYRDVFGSGIHLQYAPINNGVKENIVLERYNGVNTFRFTIDVGEYYPAYLDGEAIPFLDPTTDEVALILGQADARDSYTGEETDGHFTLYNSLSLEKIREGKYTVTVTIDSDFLSDPDTVYPVIIDPSYSLPSSSFRDTTVYSGKPDTQTFYSSAYNIVGYHGTSYGEGIAFIQTKKMTDLIEKENIDPDKVCYAYYRVYEGSGKTNSSTIRLYGTASTWSQETITYNNKPEYDDGSIDFQTVNKSGWYNFDATRHVIDFLKWAKDYTGRSQTYGFALASTDSTASSKHFCSGQYTGSTTPSIIINYVSDAIYDITGLYGTSARPFKAFGRLINGDAPVFKFKVVYSGTYVFETLNSLYYGDVAADFDTKLCLYNEYFEVMGENDNKSNSSVYSNITVNLSAGTYYLHVTDNSGNTSNIQCYLIMERLNELSVSYSTYANVILEFYKIGDASSDYRCFDYAIGKNYDVDFTLTSDTLLDAAIEALKEYNYEKVSAPTSDCVIVYGLAGNHVKHFAKYQNGEITAKFGDAEILKHAEIDTYFTHYLSYGSPIAYCDNKN